MNKRYGKSGSLVGRYSNEGTTGEAGSPDFNYDNLVNALKELGISIANIWSPAGNYMANSYQQQLIQEKRTNTILWVVIGLVLALGVVLVIRKTK